MSFYVNISGTATDNDAEVHAAIKVDVQALVAKYREHIGAATFSDQAAPVQTDLLGGDT